MSADPAAAADTSCTGQVFYFRSGPGDGFAADAASVARQVACC